MYAPSSGPRISQPSPRPETVSARSKVSVKDACVGLGGKGVCTADGDVDGVYRDSYVGGVRSHATA